MIGIRGNSVTSSHHGGVYGAGILTVGGEGLRWLGMGAKVHTPLDGKLQTILVNIVKEYLKPSFVPGNQEDTMGYSVYH